MFEWLKRIFVGSNKNNFGLPKVKNKIPMPPVKPPLTEGSTLHAIKEDKGVRPMMGPPPPPLPLKTKDELVTCTVCGFTSRRHHPWCSAGY